MDAARKVVMKFRLLQAREADESTAVEERDAFCARLGVPRSALLPHDLLGGENHFDAVTEGVSAVFVGGSGRFGINDDAPWIPSFIDLLGQLADHGFPTFASCFGFQGLCVALGTQVSSDPERSEVGTFDLALTSEGSEDPLFRLLPEQFTGQQGHKDSADTLPRGAVLLARSARCPVQAIRVGGGPVYATQFHPELTVEDQRLRFTRYFDLYCTVYGQERAQKILDGMRPSTAANGLISSFVDLYVSP